MKRRFSEEQIIGLLKQHEAGATVAQLCRDNNVSQATFYKWKAKFGSMDVSEAKRLKQLEEENARLKKMMIFGDDAWMPSENCRNFREVAPRKRYGSGMMCSSRDLI